MEETRLIMNEAFFDLIFGFFLTLGILGACLFMSFIFKIKDDVFIG
jgi:hypothetical protein